MTHGIAARVFLAFLSGWAGALKRVAPIGRDRLQRTHGYSTHKIGFVLLVASTLQSVLEHCFSARLCAKTVPFGLPLSLVALALTRGFGPMAVMRLLP